MSRPLLFSAIVFAAVGWGSYPVYGDDPPHCKAPEQWTVEYAVHETPQDPNTSIEFRFELSLLAEDGDCDATGWEIAWIEVFQTDPNGGAELSWKEQNPTVPTPDGLWWVEHADVSDPQSAEFALPPHLVGEALADDPGTKDMDYDIEGVTYAPPPPPGEPPYETTSALDYELILADETEPAGEGQEVPVEVDPPTTG